MATAFKPLVPDDFESTRGCPKTTAEPCAETDRMLLAELDARRLLHGMSQSEQHFEQRPIVSVIERVQEWLVRLLRCVASGL
jgi:hypothetical protein